MMRVMLTFYFKLTDDGSDISRGPHAIVLCTRWLLIGELSVLQVTTLQPQPYPHYPIWVSTPMHPFGPHRDTDGPGGSSVVNLNRPRRRHRQRSRRPSLSPLKRQLCQIHLNSPQHQLLFRLRLVLHPLLHWSMVKSSMPKLFGCLPNNWCAIRCHMTS